MAKTTSKRGQTVDFDLMRIHQSLSNTEAPSVVIQRQSSIEDRIQQRRIQRQNHRNRKKELEQEAAEQLKQETSTLPSNETPSEVLEDVVISKPISKRPKRTEEENNDNE